MENDLISRVPIHQMQETLKEGNVGNKTIRVLGSFTF